MSTTGPRIREAVRELAPYKPGKRPGTGEPMLRLASNESPFPPSAAVREAIARAAEGSNRYPDPACSRLIAALAQHLSVPGSHIAVGNGSVQLLQELLLATSGPGDEVVFPWRSFEAYPVLSALTGATPVAVPLRPDLSADLDAVLAKVTDRTRAVLLCSPNNPTGGTLPHEDVEPFVRALPTDVLVVIDEAYREFVTDPNAVDGLVLAARFPNVVSLRTFSKAYGLAGLRVGYCISGSAAFLDVLARMHLPFSVSAAAQEAALAALGEQNRNSHQMAALVQIRGRMTENLRVQGWQVPESQGNFIWISTPHAEAVAVVLEENCVLARCFPGDGVRVTVPAQDDLPQLVRATQSAAQLLG